ncbi:antitoxin [Tepidicella baoligensis]|uniref:antitoxin n=1 Tax=Tepidicella baoligensis TaxID=2707016 RepID=UPI0015DB9871|nr:AbrB/MazE/SpoVT family DNA-binding domain-containing protein [Tepidicella baoligensis]
MATEFSSKNPSVRRQETSVFQSGNSQAVRIPKEFQLNTKRVEIFREGRSIVLRPKPMTAAEALDDLPVLTEAEAAALDRAMEQLDDLPPLDEPVWGATEKASKKTRRA